MDFLPTPSGGLFGGYRFDPAGADLHLLLPDPHTFPTDYLFAHLTTHAPETTVRGGLAAARTNRG
jgi:small ligand-binding sensory domain FIST